MTIAFLGIGNVGSALAIRLASLGYRVHVAARDAGSPHVQAAIQKEPRLKVLPVEEAARSSDIIFLATPFQAVEEVLGSIGDINGKIVVDCTNPVGPGLSHGLKGSESGGEFIQRLIPSAHVVKAFSVYGYENFLDNNYSGYGDLKPAMLLAGNDADAKVAVMELCTRMGWHPVDTGDISMSLHLEHLALLWIKMARAQGRGAGFVWAMLERNI